MMGQWYQQYVIQKFTNHNKLNSKSCQDHILIIMGTGSKDRLLANEVGKIVSSSGMEVKPWYSLEFYIMDIGIVCNLMPQLINSAIKLPAWTFSKHFTMTQRDLCAETHLSILMKAYQ